jgi:ATP-dependent protease Clp ATPase subunit
VANPNSENQCFLCGKTASEVKKMIVGPEGCICDYCVATCYTIMANSGVDMDETVERVKTDIPTLRDGQ